MRHVLPGRIDATVLSPGESDTSLPLKGHVRNIGEPITRQNGSSKSVQQIPPALIPAVVMCIPEYPVSGVNAGYTSND